MIGLTCKVSDIAKLILAHGINRRRLNNDVEANCMVQSCRSSRPSRTESPQTLSLGYKLNMKPRTNFVPTFVNEVREECCRFDNAITLKPLLFSDKSETRSQRLRNPTEKGELNEIDNA